MTTSRSVDENGFLTVVGCPLSSFGILQYSAGQIGLPGDPNRIVNVYRPESAVTEPGYLESLKNIPFIVDHTMLSGFEGDENAEAPEDKGLDGVLTSNVSWASPWVIGDLKIFSRKAQRDLAKGKKDLSLGFNCEFEVKPGVWDGQSFEVVQNKMRGNHIALVGEGRVPGARVLDGLCFDHLSFAVPSDEETTMLKKGKKSPALDNAVLKLKALLPELAEYLNQEAAEPVHQDNTEGEPGAVDPAAVAAEPTVAAEPAAAEPAAADPAAVAAEPGGAEGESELPGLIAQVEELLSKLKEACAGNSEATNAGEPATTDDVEGLQESAGSSPNGAVDNTENGEQGKASPGPSAGVNAKAEDASLRHFYGDLAAKTGLYDRLSKVVGAFDSSRMDARQVAAYGVKKLGIKCADGQEPVAVDAYLSAVEAAGAKAREALQKTHTVAKHAADGKTGVSEVDSYLNG